MLRKAKRFFNTSGPNNPAQHYTLKREGLIVKGLELVKNERYFTIWAPRQTGKSTYLNVLSGQLKKLDYRVAHINVENYKEAPRSAFFNYLYRVIAECWGITLKNKNFGDFQDGIAKIKEEKCVLIVDEVEGLNQEYFGQFLHSIRNLYHFRNEHCLKNVILVGVSNIVGVVEDNASPFNIADNLDVPYFTAEETSELLGMHETETGQVFSQELKEKMIEMTANQPGLLNGIAYQLVTRWPNKEVLDIEELLMVEDWYLNEAVDKNISNIINKAKQHRKFVEKLLFTDSGELFKINDEKIKFLHAHGLLRRGDDGTVDFWVPMYRKAVYDAFYPYTNGEKELFFRTLDSRKLVDAKGKIDFGTLIDNYKAYVKRRGFRYFREKDEKTGEYKSLKEAALAYSFETYIQAFLQEVGGKSYLEPHTGLGRSDLVVNASGHEYVIEFKIYRSPAQFDKGKEQLAYYAGSIGVNEGVYLVFVPNTIKMPSIKEGIEKISSISIRTFIVYYDEEKDF